jgi:hypothetical protein
LNFILVVKSERKKTFGGRKLAAPHVQGLWQAKDKKDEKFALLKHKFPKIYEFKITEGILFGTQIKQLFEKNDNSTKFNATE